MSGPPEVVHGTRRPRLWLHPSSIIITVRHSSRKKGVYSVSGTYGDATLATRHKGEIVMRAVVDGILKEIEELRSDSHG